jgi:ABC-type multidrug transport system ATPase subunit
MAADRPKALQLDELTVRVAGKTIVERAALEVASGEIVLLIGPSGAGKSILLQLVAGVLDQSSPDVEVEGRIAIGGVEVARARGRTGLVFQDHALFDDLSARDNLMFAMAHRHANHHEQPGSSRADELLAHFGLDHATPVRVMSGGQKQRLAIARTLAHDPEILIYDEPTTGLDPASTEAVVSWIERTHREQGKTTLIVTHD